MRIVCRYFTSSYNIGMNLEINNSYIVSAFSFYNKMLNGFISFSKRFNCISCILVRICAN